MVSAFWIFHSKESIGLLSYFSVFCIRYTWGLLSICWLPIWCKYVYLFSVGIQCEFEKSESKKCGCFLSRYLQIFSVSIQKIQYFPCLLRQWHPLLCQYKWRRSILSCTSFSFMKTNWCVKQRCQVGNINNLCWGQSFKAQ